MKVIDLQHLLEQLPDDADIVIGEVGNDFRLDHVAGVDRMLIQEGVKGQGGKVVAGVLRFRCMHK